MRSYFTIKTTKYEIHLIVYKITLYLIFRATFVALYLYIFYYLYCIPLLFISLLNFPPIKTATTAFIKSPGIKGAEPNKKLSLFL